MNDEEELCIVLAGMAAAAVVRALPVDLAISALMTAVVQLIQHSATPMAHWETLAAGIEAHKRIQPRLRPGPERLQ